jgi:cytochrome P450
MKQVLDKIDWRNADVRSLAHSDDPYAVYRLMREQEARFHSFNTPSWQFTRHRDIVAVLREEHFGLPQPFLTLPPWRELVSASKASAPHPTGSPPVSHQLNLLQTKVLEMRQHWILLLNPPAHTRLRGLVQPHFNLNAVGHLDPSIQETADALIDGYHARGEMDLIRDFAGPLTLRVMFLAMGIPLDDRVEFERLARNLGHFLHSDAVPKHSVHLLRMTMAGIGLTEYFRKRIEARQEPDGDDVISSLVRSFKAGKLDEDELLAMCTLLSLGGYGTTRSMIGNAMLAFLRHRDRWELLKRQPELITGAVEECLRYDTTGQTAGRLAYADFDLDGTRIIKGEWVNLVLGAGNRDPEVFPEPDRFDITRSVNPHLSFGHGIHYCLGAHLARSIMRTAISALVRRVPNIALRDESVKWSADMHLRGLETLPVVF